MGCHTWIYVHLSEKQEEYREIILKDEISACEQTLKHYKNFNDLEDFFKADLKDAKKVLEQPKEELREYFGDDLESVLERYKRIQQMTLEDYKKECIREVTNKLNRLKEQGLENDYDGYCFDGNFCYRIINGKIYTDKISKHGNDLGRVTDYPSGQFWNAKELIEYFNQHPDSINKNYPPDPQKIKEAFEEFDDMFVEFG